MVWQEGLVRVKGCHVPSMWEVSRIDMDDMWMLWPGEVVFPFCSIFFNRQREKIWMIATGGQLLETLPVWGPSMAWPSIVPRTRKIMSSHVPQAYSTCWAPIPKHAQGVMNAFHCELWIFTGNKRTRSMASGRRMGFPPVLLFFHTAYTSTYLHLFLSLWMYHGPLKIGSRLPCPQKAEIFLTQRPTSIGTCYEIRWFGWFLHSMFILSIPIWDALKGFLSTQNCSHLRSWLQTNLGGSWRCCERGMPFVYFDDCFFKIAVLCFVFCLPFTNFV